MMSNIKPTQGQLETNKTDWSTPSSRDIKPPILPYRVLVALSSTSVGLAIGTGATVASLSGWTVGLGSAAATITSSLVFKSKFSKHKKKNITIPDDSQIGDAITPLFSTRQLIANYIRQEVSVPLYEVGYSTSSKEFEKLATKLEDFNQTQLGRLTRTHVMLALKIESLKNRSVKSKEIQYAKSKALKALKATEDTVEKAPVHLSDYELSLQAHKILTQTHSPIQYSW